MTEEHKQKLKEGREKRRLEKANGTYVKKVKVEKEKSKPVVFITNKEKNAFDFFKSIRLAFRKEGNYILEKKVLKEITDKDWWQNVSWIKNVLSKYVDFEIVTEKKYNRIFEKIEEKKKSFRIDWLFAKLLVYY